MPNDEPGSLQRLRRDFGQWLAGNSFRWTDFATFTFRRPPGRGAIRHADVFLRDLAGELERPPITAFVSHEIGPEGGRGHLHALLDVRGVSARFIADEWIRKFGFARVSPYNPKLGGLHYVTKYVIKDCCQRADWRLLPTHGKGQEYDLFRASKRVTGYQLYTRYLAEVERERGG